MNFVHIRSVAAVSLLSLLTACGGADFEAATPTAQAAAPARSVVEAAVGPDAAAATPADLANGPVDQIAESGGQNPVPDCEADKCQGLRIIDGNAEAYRFDTMRRSEAQAGSST